MADKPDDFTKEPKLVWRTTSLSAGDYPLAVHERNTLQDEGWEPFAVDDGQMHYRKRFVVQQ